jgi:alkylation response protein AidB-like acyl-CoA dehydrogenase
MSGEKLAALAFVEPQARFNLSDVETSAEESAGGFVLNGFKAVVIGGPSADYLVVPARTSGSRVAEDGITLFLVDAKAEGVVLRNYPTIDGHQASEINLDKVSVESSHVIGEIGKGFPILEEAIDKGILAVGAEAVGAMEVLYKSTVEYCKTREQFGQPIGKFQVLQHRMVDMFMEHEQSKSLLFMAAIKMSSGDEAEKKRFRLLVLHKHIYHTVLEDLKFSYWLTKLFSCFTIFNCGFIEHLHSPYRLCSNSKNAFIDSFL